MDLNSKILYISDNHNSKDNIFELFLAKDIPLIAIETFNCISETFKFDADCVIIDVEFDDYFNAKEFADIIKKGNHSPIILFTNEITKDIIQNNNLLECEAIFTKNQDTHELIDKTEAIIQKINSEKEHYLLIESQNKFKALFDSAKDSIIFLDSNGVIKDWNNSAENLFQYKKFEVNGQKIWDLIISPENRAEFHKSFDIWVNSENIVDNSNRMELYCIKKNGNYIPIELSLSFSSINNTKIIIAFLRDITEKIASHEEIEKLLEEMQVTKDIVEQNASELVLLNYELQDREEKLEELNASKDKFFSIIAHDLKNPFQSLLGYSQLLNQDIEFLEKNEIRDFSANLHASAEKLFKLLENLLAWSRLQRGVMELRPDNYILSDITLGNIELAALKAKEKNIELIHNIDYDIWVYCDYQMVNTVIRNLISNALKFTDANGKIEVGAIVNENVTIFVKDNGVGMSKEIQDKIFRIDTHHSTLGTSDEQGTGLGLILCKELVEKNQGKLWVESEVGNGSTFYFTIAKGSVPEFD